MLLQPTASRPRQAVWSLGFRPFFLGGSLFALIALLLWAGVLAGALAPAPPGGMLAWHRHEMLYGVRRRHYRGFSADRRAELERHPRLERAGAAGFVPALAAGAGKLVYATTG